MKRIWCIILGLIPVINFWLQYYFTKQEKIVSIFKKHWICYRLDWIFIPINTLFIFLITTVSRETILLLGIGSLIINYVVHYFRSIDNHIENSHIIHPQITKAGRVHMIFSSIEFLIIALILVSPSQWGIIYSELWLLTVFIGWLIYGGYRIHKKLYRSDVMTIIVLWAAIIAKVVYLR
jgi:hypothetical protein